MPHPWITAALLPALLASVAPAQQRVLPLGDSITESAGGYPSYRYYLWKKIDAADRCADFVGWRSGVAAGVPLYQDFDQEHSGCGGYQATWLAALVSLGIVQLPAVDIALVHLGTNDIVLPLALGLQPDLNAACVAVQQLVLALRAQNPSVKIALAQILPIDPASTVVPTAHRFVPVWNEIHLPQVAAMSTAASPILLVDQNTGLDPSLHFRDTVHPNDLGEQILADRWFKALDNNGWLQSDQPCVSTLSPGCADARSRQQPPRLFTASKIVPSPGAVLPIGISGLPADTFAAALIIGASEAALPLVWSTCPVHPSLDIFFLSGPALRADEAGFTVQLPPWTPLGMHLYLQAVTYSTSVDGATTSNGLQMLVY